VIVVSELPGVHRAGADIPNLATLNEIVKTLHRFLGSRVVEISPMDLEEVDVRSVEPLQRRLDLVKDGRTSKTTLVDVVSGVLECRHGVGDLVNLVMWDAEALGQNDEAMTWNVEL
jgi:hypothetical protein